jgi:F-type H+-transporting ATPase subunit epsilon
VRTFVLHLQDALHHERVDDVETFVGRDPSGSFGLLAGHERFMTTLVFGLARFRCAGGAWEYLAVPGALVYFCGDALVLNTRRFLRDTDYGRIGGLLVEQLAAEERELGSIRESLRRLEGEMLRRLWELGRKGEGPIR